MSDATIHPFTLRFASPYLEAAFRADHARRSVRLVRAAIVLGVSQFLLFGLLDRVMVPEAFREIQLIRAVTAVPMLACIALTFAPWFERRMQAVMVVPPMLAGLAVSAMAIAGEASEYYDYYAGLILVLIYVHVLLRLSFVAATTVGSVLIAVFLGVTAAIGTPQAALMNTASFVISANATGMIASYALERYARQAFYQSRQQQRTNTELASVLEGLRTAQARLIQQEKMASLGRLTAGVAHEIKNPLNFVNNFAGLSVDLADELGEALSTPGEQRDRAAPALLDDLRQNVAKIREHGQRADRIVRGMLEHAGATRGSARAVDVNHLVEARATLARDAFGHRHPGFMPAFTVDPGADLPDIAGIPQELDRVVSALVDNALQAVLERTASAGAGAGGDGAAYVPSVTVRTSRVEPATVRIEVADNGVGIPSHLRERVFEPFFTTRTGGAGIGLDLSLVYEFVVKSHGGTITFDTEEGRGTTFVVDLPVGGERLGD